MGWALVQSVALDDSELIPTAIIAHLKEHVMNFEPGKRTLDIRGTVPHVEIVLRAFERAEIEPDPARMEEASNMVSGEPRKQDDSC